MRQAQFSLFEDKKRQKGIYISLEKIYILSILLILILLTAFIAGTERGKRQINKTEKVNPNNVQILDRDRFIEKKAEDNIDKAPQMTSGKTNPIVKNRAFYSVQIACYSKKDVAVIQAHKLKNKGITPILRNKGKYLILYAGEFQTRNKAEKLKKELKNFFSDSIIVKLNYQ